MSQKNDQKLSPVGAHLSIKGGFSELKSKMKNINATSCAFFLKTNRKFEGKPLDKKDAEKFKEIFKETTDNISINNLIPHASYLINLANATEKREKHLNCFFDELERCQALGIKFINIHPGSDTSKLGKIKACKLVSDAINDAHLKYKEVTILLENMAGQGNTLCSNFQEIKLIIDNINDKDRIGVCIDTAHLHGAGFDLRKKESYEKIFFDFDKIIGLNYLKAFHLNDSKIKIGEKKDRHEQIGIGTIGMNAFRFIMQDERFVNIPKILETPDENMYQREIEVLRRLEAENKK